MGFIEATALLVVVEGGGGIERNRPGVEIEEAEEGTGLRVLGLARLLQEGHRVLRLGPLGGALEVLEDRTVRRQVGLGQRRRVVLVPDVEAAGADLEDRAATAAVATPC